jgi:hypothetical protein
MSSDNILKEVFLRQKLIVWLISENSQYLPSQKRTSGNKLIPFIEACFTIVSIM